MKKDIYLIGLTIILCVCVWQIIKLNFELVDYLSFKPKMIKLNQDLKELNDSLKSNSKNALSEYSSQKELIFKDELSNYADSLMDNNLLFYSKQLENINNQIVVENKNLSEIIINKQRAINDLPETVSLDELYNKYKKNQSETFYTSRGRISFSSYHFSFLTVPSSGEVAYIRIGKEDSSENSALIKAFLEESAKSKTKQGYYLVSNKEHPADYGSYRIKKYKKGDSYFITYYQYTRY